MFKKINKTIPITDTLFGDLPLDYWANTGSNEMPWNLFREAKESLDKGNKDKAIETLKNIISLPDLESRQYLQAYYFLSNLGVLANDALQIFGVVVEVGMPEGVDLLAVYADRSSRYYNYSGRAIIWEASDQSLDNKIDDVLTQSMEVVRQIGPWKDARRPAPSDGMARLNFLTSHGLHFGEAAQSVLFRDPMAGKLMYALLDIMNTLITKTTGSDNL